MGKRHKAREAAVQCLYQWDVTGRERDVIFAGFRESQELEASEAQDFAEELFDGVVAHADEIDAMIAGQSEHWRVDRLGLVEKSILRLGVYELMFEPDTPPAVAMNEAVELAKRFSGPEAGPFVNGVLDAISKRLQAGDVSEDE